jgi:hypothetical protein
VLIRVLLGVALASPLAACASDVRAIRGSVATGLIVELTPAAVRS